MKIKLTFFILLLSLTSCANDNSDMNFDKNKSKGITISWDAIGFSFSLEKLWKIEENKDFIFKATLSSSNTNLRIEAASKRFLSSYFPSSRTYNQSDIVEDIKEGPKINGGKCMTHELYFDDLFHKYYFIEKDVDIENEIYIEIEIQDKNALGYKFDYIMNDMCFSDLD